MKAVCTSEARLNGLRFNPGEEYYFEEQVFTEAYIPAIHPQPARGHRIRYIRYKATLPMDVELDDLHGMTEVRTAYFYDRFYCLHHDWKDERGQATECFDDHFSICEAQRQRYGADSEETALVWSSKEDKRRCDGSARGYVTLKVGDRFQQAWKGCKEPMWFKVLSINRPNNSLRVECHSFGGDYHEEEWDDLDVTESAFDVGEYKMIEDKED